MLTRIVRTRPSARFSAILVLVPVLASSALLTFQVLGEAAGQAFFYAVRLLTAVAAGTAMIVASRRARGRLRKGRGFVAAALFTGAASGVVLVGTVLVTGGPPSMPSVADAVYLLTFPLAVAAVLAYPVSDVEEGSRLRILLDGVIAALALWFLTYVLILSSPEAGAPLPGATRATLLAYPAAAVFVIGMIAGVIPRVRDDARSELTTICAGLLLMSVFEIAYTAQVVSTGSWRLDNWIGALAELGLGVVLLAALSSAPTFGSPAPLMRMLGLLPFVPVIAAMALALSLIVQGRMLTPAELGIGVAAGVVLLLRLLVGNRDKNQLLKRLSSKEQLYRSLVLGSSDMITLQTRDGAIRYASPAMSRFTGLPEDVLLGSNFADLVDPADRPELVRRLAEVRQTPGMVADTLCRLRAHGGEPRWTLSRIHNLLADPNVAGVVVNTRDVHEHQSLQQRLTHQAYHDELTGLPNLAQAHEWLARRCFGAKGPAGGVILVDLDGFKAINDTYGHPFGDKVLRLIGQRLATAAGADCVARIGGDEFVVVLRDADVTTLTVEKILTASRRPVVVGEIELTVGASAGVAMGRDGEDADELLRNADLAMYVAKSQGRNRAHWYEPQMHAASAERMEITRGLRRALDDGHLALAYQPIVRLADADLIACEALLRWRDPQRGLIPPDSFIGVAEESALILELGEWVLDNACAELARWRAQGLDVPHLNINISRRQITAELPGRIAAVLRRHGLVPTDLCLEITESAVLADAEQAVGVLQRIRESGVMIALDDFGTGQSSVSQLTSLPVDIVKIDKSFVVADRSVPRASALLRSIVQLCSNLALPTVAEGIEDRQTALELISAGCVFGQGYYFARPQAAGAFLAGLRELVVSQRGALGLTSPGITAKR